MYLGTCKRPVQWSSESRIRTQPPERKLDVGQGLEVLASGCKSSGGEESSRGREEKRGELVEEVKHLKV